MNEQLNLFAASYERAELPKHVRLIELFAGIGAQSKGMGIIGADFEHWRTCEWSWQSITAYNAIHMGGNVEDTSNLTYEEVLGKIKGVSHDYNQPMTEKQLRAKGEKWARDLLGRMLANRNYCPNVSELHADDLGIEDKENNTYCLFYSFPCTDLSNAGLMKGMEKGSGTRSGLLWEVERILLECQSKDCLPQVLCMENVPNVVGSGNLNAFNQWLDALEKMGYTNYWKILNAKDFGIPQNRKRCFMVSILGEYSFHFPKKMKLRYRLKDFIHKKVDESYYLSDKLVASFQRHTEKQDAKGNGFRFEPTKGGGIAHSILTRAGDRPCDNFLKASIDTYNDTMEIDPEASDTIQTRPQVPNHGERIVVEEERLYIPSATEKGYMEAKEGDGVLPSWKGARGTVQDGAIPTLLTSPETIGVVVKDDDEE